MSLILIANTFLVVQEAQTLLGHNKLCKSFLVRNAWPCTVRKMANTGFVVVVVVAGPVRFVKWLTQVLLIQRYSAKIG